MKKSVSNFNEPVLQRILVATVVLAMLAMLALQVYFSYQLARNNPNLSSFSYIFIGLMAPIASFVLAYLMHKSSSALVRTFDAVTMAVVASAFYGVLSMVGTRIFQLSSYNTGGFFNFFLQDLIVAGVTLVVLAGLLVTLKRQKRW